MRHIRQFDQHAHSYEHYKIIQSKVARHLVQGVRRKGRNIVDLGAGSGEVYRAIDWEFDRFIAVDMSANMLRLHPDKKVEKRLCNFDEEGCLLSFVKEPIDLVLSASALQWSQNLDHTLANIAKISSNVAFALFTSNTFATIHNILGITSPIYSKDEIVNALCRHFMLHLETRAYKLFFVEKKELFEYIKKSGVSAGKKRASIKELRSLIRDYPFSYLEFEVVFAWSRG